MKIVTNFPFPYFFVCLAIPNQNLKYFKDWKNLVSSLYDSPIYAH